MVPEAFRHYIGCTLISDMLKKRGSSGWWRLSYSNRDMKLAVTRYRRSPRIFAMLPARISSTSEPTPDSGLGSPLKLIIVADAT